MYGLQAWDGVTAWKSDYLGNIKRIFLKKVISREDETEYSEVVVVTDEKMITLDSVSGKEVSSEALGIDVLDAQLMLVQTEEGNTAIMAVDKTSGRILKIFGGHQPKEVYYSTIDRTKGAITGYKLGRNPHDTKLWQVSLGLENGEEIHQVIS